MQGFDPDDHACANRSIEPSLSALEVRHDRQW
jgi:hypothetical protein